MSGTYAFHGFTATNSLPGFPFEIGEFGTVLADGAGTLTGMSSTNDGGVVSALAPLPDALYSVFPGGSWTTRLPAETGSAYEGGVSPTGDLVFAGASRPAGVPGLRFYARKRTGFSLASLNGMWHCASIFDFPSALYGNFVFDGVGGVDRNVAITGLAVLAPLAGGSYTVAADGVVDLLIPGISALRGQISGDVLVFSGTSEAADFQIAGVAVRAGAGLTDAVLDGEYFAVGMQNNGSWQSLTGVVTADGVGGVTASFLQNDEGLLSIEGPLPAAYTVAGNGALTFTTGTNNIGGCSPDGSVAVIGGGTVGGDDPFFLVLLRR